MNRPLGFLIRLLLLASLIVASMPTGATETVCVLGKAKIVVTLARCGMPCCAPRAAEPLPTKRNCCALKASLRFLSVRSCRCETRLIKGSTPPPTAVAPTASPLEQPAMIVAPAIATPLPIDPAVEPGIVGLDSGPPRRRPRTPGQSRAPPVLL